MTVFGQVGFKLQQGGPRSGEAEPQDTRHFNHWGQSSKTKHRTKTKWVH